MTNHFLKGSCGLTERAKGQLCQIPFKVEGFDIISLTLEKCLDSHTLSDLVWSTPLLTT